MVKMEGRELSVAGVLATARTNGQVYLMDSVLERERARLREMTATAKVAVMDSLWRQAWQLKAAGLRGQHLDWTPEQVEAAVREIFLAERD